MKIVNNFGKDNKYKLYRTMYEIIHPTISKKNISNYRIVLDDSIAPIRVFYPNKVSLLNSVIIYIPGELHDSKDSYTKYLEELAKKTDKLVLAIDYNMPINFKECFDTVKYLYKVLDKINISSDNICLIGDSIGANIVNNIVVKKNRKFEIEKNILINPVFGNLEEIKKNKDNAVELDSITKYIDNYIVSSSDIDFIKSKTNINTKTLFLVGASDFLREEVSTYVSNLDNTQLVTITFADHYFIWNGDVDAKEELYKEINNFFNNK